MLMHFDLSSPRLVLAGTLFGEVRGWGRPAAENVAQIVLNRVADKWDPGGIVGVCLAAYQFSCWNPTDPNRAKIMAAPTDKAEALSWLLALAVADRAIIGNNPNRVQRADSYFAKTIAKPDWATAPAVHTYSDAAHNFWRTRMGASEIGAPNHPVQKMSHAESVADLITDSLNEGQLAHAEDKT